MASMLTIAPAMASKSSSLGIGTISLDFSATLICPSTSRWRAAKAEIMWIGALTPFLLVGASQRLAIDGDHISGRPSQGRDPSDEAALEFLGVERREDVAEVIVRGSTIAKWPEPAQ